MMKISRREAIKLSVAGTGALMSPLVWPDLSAEVAGSCDQPYGANQAQGVSPSNYPKFQAPLKRLTPLSKSPQTNVSNPDIDYYEITMSKQRLGVVFDANENPITFAEFWTYNGSIPGSLIRQPWGRQSCVRFTNQLGADLEGNQICTSVHLHGMASLPQFDGYATDLTQSGQYKDYYYPNSRSSSLWYHDHAIHHTSRNVYMGLAGMYIVEYRPQDFCGGSYLLPQGEFEVPLVIQDKAFAIGDTNPNEWKLVFNDRNRQGVYADVYMVNGRAYPTLKVKRQKYYFRLLNGSASRSYRLTLSRSQTQLTNTQDPLIVIGSDAGLLASPVPLVAPQSLPIGVGERYGVVIDFAEFPADVKTVYLWDIGFSGNISGTAQAILQFELEGAPMPSPKLPNKIGIVPLKEELQRIRRQQLQQAGKPEAVKDRAFVFNRNGGEWKINNKTWEEARIDGNPTLWGVEVWEIFNNGGWVHPVHIHLIDFQILDRNGRPPLPHERGWKDVVLVEPFEKVRVIASFNPQPGKYMFHCHNIVHEDHDMMTQFEVKPYEGFPPPPFSTDPKTAAPAQDLPAKPLGTFDLPDYKLPAFSYGDLKTSCSPP
jgi:spore coat protein A, manganese oxidase